MVIEWPSGVAVAPAVWPTAPLPPVRFTTVTGCPSSFSSSTATMRAMRSVPPPAAHGQMSWMGRLGYLACAAASEGGRPATSARHTKATTDDRIHLALMRDPPLDGGHGTIAARMAAAHPRRTLLQKPPPRPRPVDGARSLPRSKLRPTDLLPAHGALTEARRRLWFSGHGLSAARRGSGLGHARSSSRRKAANFASTSAGRPAGRREACRPPG